MGTREAMERADKAMIEARYNNELAILEPFRGKVICEGFKLTITRMRNRPNLQAWAYIEDKNGKKRKHTVHVGRFPEDAEKKIMAYLKKKSLIP